MLCMHGKKIVWLLVSYLPFIVARSQPAKKKVVRPNIIIINMDDKSYAINNNINHHDHKDQRKTNLKLNKSFSHASGQHSNSAFLSTSHSNTSMHSNSTPTPSILSSNPIPIEVNMIKHSPLSTEEKKHCRHKGLCFYCSKGKYIINNCSNMFKKVKKCS